MLSHLLVLAASLSLVLHGVLHGSMRAYLWHLDTMGDIVALTEETNSARYEWLSNCVTY